MTERRAGFWLDTYMAYTQQAEAPDSYHLWSAISAVAACLQRKVWLNWGFFNVYPNLYIILVGPPGTRKNTAIDIAMDLIQDIKTVHFSADCTTGPSLVEAIKESEAILIFDDGKKMTHCSITVVSKEFKLFLKADINMSTWLTDLFDSRKIWTYRTKNKGTYPVEGVWLNLIGGVTPSWFSHSMAHEAIGEGFTSRILFIVEEAPRKLTAHPRLTPIEFRMQEDLIHDLNIIHSMKGEFRLDAEADEWFTQWYEHPKDNPLRLDDRFSGYFARKHIHLLKTAIVVSACISNSQIITLLNMEHALDLIESTENRMVDAFGAAGRSIMSADIDDVMKLLKKYERLSREQILSQIWRDVSPLNVDHVFKTLQEMKLVEIEPDGKGKIWYKWIRKEEEK